jgi:beta-glucanase (GH16 family)/regulation of enolase protein 1 (concanavalin A-like superfamily)
MSPRISPPLSFAGVRRSFPSGLRGFLASVLLLGSPSLFALPPGNWTQTFSEEFSGTALDATKWSTGYTWSPVINGELQGMRPENVTVANGVCTIKIEKRTVNNQAFGGYNVNYTSPYASGAITTFNKFTQTYGYFEARIQTSACPGAWPAFWMLPDRGPAYGPAAVDNIGQRSTFTGTGLAPGAEIDILESFGSWKRPDGSARGRQGFIWQYGGGSLSSYYRNQGLGDWVYISNPDTTWHTYGLYWANGTLTAYLDDQIVGYWTSPNVPSAPMYLLLNCAISTDDWQPAPYPTTAEIDAALPSNIKIDWVRAYTGTAAAPVPFTNTWLGRDLDNGTAGPVGSDTWDANFTSCTITAPGTWGILASDGDWGRFTFKSMKGDGSIVARVTRIDDVGNSNASAGLFIREDANFKSKSAYLFTSPTYGNHGMRVRLTATGTTTSGTAKLGQQRPVWMKLTRVGDTFTGYYSSDGANWGTPVYSSTIPMNPIVQIGLGTSSRSANLTTAVYDNITVTAVNGPTTDMALGRLAIASSSETASYPPSKAVDGNSSSRWSSSFMDNQWIYVDLGGTVSFSRVKLKWENAYASGYKIQTSNNASTWTDVYSTTSGNGSVDDITGLTASGRYVRVLCTTRATGFGISLFDFEVYP